MREFLMLLIEPGAYGLQIPVVYSCRQKGDVFTYCLDGAIIRAVYEVYSFWWLGNVSEIEVEFGYTFNITEF